MGLVISNKRTGEHSDSEHLCPSLFHLCLDLLLLKKHRIGVFPVRRAWLGTGSATELSQELCGGVDTSVAGRNDVPPIPIPILGNVCQPTAIPGTGRSQWSVFSCEYGSVMF